MAQLDKFIIIMQIFWFLLLFFCFYWIFVLKFLPLLFKIIRIRFLLNFEIINNLNILIINSAYYSNYLYNLFIYILFNINQIFFDQDIKYSFLNILKNIFSDFLKYFSINSNFLINNNLLLIEYFNNKIFQFFQFNMFNLINIKQFNLIVYIIFADVFGNNLASRYWFSKIKYKYYYYFRYFIRNRIEYLIESL
jgi:hypothetical protein